MALQLQDEVGHEETTANIRFLFIDCGPLKQTLISHCELWRTKLTGLLNSMAANELRGMHEHFKSSLEALARPPTNLDQLAESVKLHRKLVEERPKMEGKFEPLRWGSAGLLLLHAYVELMRVVPHDKPTTYVAGI